MQSARDWGRGYEGEMEEEAKKDYYKRYTLVDSPRIQTIKERTKRSVKGLIITICPSTPQFCAGLRLLFWFFSFFFFCLFFRLLLHNVTTQHPRSTHAALTQYSRTRNTHTSRSAAQTHKGIKQSKLIIITVYQHSIRIHCSTHTWQKLINGISNHKFEAGNRKPKFDGIRKLENRKLKWNIRNRNLETDNSTRRPKNLGRIRFSFSCFSRIFFANWNST